jgi:hypothetical protein
MPCSRTRIGMVVRSGVAAWSGPAGGRRFRPGGLQIVAGEQCADVQFSP